MSFAEATCPENRGTDLKAFVTGSSIHRLEDKRQGRTYNRAADVTDRDGVEAACSSILKAFRTVDILVNGAGGNKPGATTGPDLSFFDIPRKALESVMDVNLLGTIIPCQVFARVMAEKSSGVILNTSSVVAIRLVTKVLGYSAPKAGVSNFTHWLAVHTSQNYSKEIRVNAFVQLPVFTVFTHAFGRPSMT